MRAARGLWAAAAVLAWAPGASCTPAATPVAGDPVPETVSFLAADSVRVFAHRYAAPGDSARPIVLAFHQAGADGRGEYGPMAARLLAEGWDLVAVDQRSGGDRFGGDNMTVTAHGKSTGYCEAMPDLRAAIVAARAWRPDAPIVAWGSSYSAALVLRLAAERPDGLAGVCAFSPASGGPMEDCRGEEVSDRIEVPVLVLRPASEMANESVARQGETFLGQGHALYVANPGVHGASMLVAERAGGDPGATWKTLLAFMRDAVSRAPSTASPSSE